MKKQGKYEDWQVEDVGNGYAIYQKDVNQEWEDENGENLLFQTEGEAHRYLRRVFDRDPTEEEIYKALDRAGIIFVVVRIEEGLREIAVCVEEKKHDSR